MKRKSLLVSTVVLATILVVVVSASFSSKPLKTSPFEPLKISGHIVLTIHRVDGSIEVYETDNTVMTNGKTYVRDALTDGATVAEVQYIALSTDTTATPPATWTNLPSEVTGNGLDRATGTISDDGDTGFKVEKTFTATAQQLNIQMSGLCWGANSGGGTPDDGTLFAAAHFTSVNLEDGDSLTVTWTITIT